jgi:hypothetical protein
MMDVTTRLAAGAASLTLSVAIIQSTPAAQVRGASRERDMDRIAPAYVRLALAMGLHDPDYVDAFYGPPEWKGEVESAKPPLEKIAADAAALLAELDKVSAGADEMRSLRKEYLHKQLSSLLARTRMLKGGRLSFDNESQALYDAVAPVNPDSHFQAILSRLEPRFPGEGTLLEQYERWRKPFVIPREKLDLVFQTAIKECRARTAAHMKLPAGESFTVEYVTNKSWSGYNWYQGQYRSLIQVNTDLPVYIDRAIDLACHEGYPGHHVYNALLEQHLVRDRGWVEFTVYPLFSPQSLIAEGTANYGIEVAFPGSERVNYERAVLFTAAGLDPARAAEYYEVQGLVEELSYAGNEAARRYLNGNIDQTAAAAWLERFALMSPERAKQRVRFFDQYRSYVINYNVGKDLVERYVESRGGTTNNPRKRWEEFGRLLASPRLPSGLR